MADIRIKDLATTATTTASGDFMAVDGTINGTRKLSATAPAFLTSVTTPSLTSPAANNLTLGLGTGGTALTLASSTLAATFAGAVSGITTLATSGLITATGSASTSAALRLDNPSGSAGTAQYYANLTAGGTTIGRISRGNGLAGYSENGINIDNFSGFQVGLNVLGVSAGSFNVRTAGTTDLFTVASTGAATFAGAVTVSSTTASSGVGTGALQVAGGAYIGGASVFGSGVSTGGLLSSTNLTLSAASAARIYWNAGQTGWIDYTSDNWTFRHGGTGTTSLTLASTGAATFAGAVTVGGNVGFYNASPVAKPTGVAVTAAAIHAALVTLNLIAA